MCLSSRGKGFRKILFLIIFAYYFYSNFSSPHAEYHHYPQEDVYYEYDPNPHPRYNSRGGPSGPQFLDGVTAIFDGAATGAIHPQDVGAVIGGSLLEDIHGKKL